MTDGDDRRTSRTLMCVTDWYIVSCGEIGASRTALHNVLRYKINNDYTLDNEIQLKNNRDVRAYTRSTSRSLAGEQNKSAVTDHAISLNHVMDWDQAKVIDRESNRVDRWIKEAIHIRKEKDKSMNRDEVSYQLSHIYDNLFAPNLSGERRLDRPFRRRPPSRPKGQGCFFN